MRDQYTREKFDWEPSVPSLALSSAFEIRAQGSAPSATTEVDSYFFAAFRVSILSRSAFRQFSCHGQPTRSAAVLPYWDLALFRVGNLVLILRPENSERPPPTRPPTEIPKSLSSRY